MTSYWAAYAWLPEGCRAGVGFDVEDGRFAQVRVGVDQEPATDLARRDASRLPTATATLPPGSGAEHTAQAAPSGPASADVRPCRPPRS